MHDANEYNDEHDDQHDADRYEQVRNDVEGLTLRLQRDKLSDTLTIYVQQHGKDAFGLRIPMTAAVMMAHSILQSDVSNS